MNSLFCIFPYIHELVGILSGQAIPYLSDMEQVGNIILEISNAMIQKCLEQSAR